MSETQLFGLVCALAGATLLLISVMTAAAVGVTITVLVAVLFAGVLSAHRR